MLMGIRRAMWVNVGVGINIGLPTVGQAATTGFCSHRPASALLYPATEARWGTRVTASLVDSHGYGKLQHTFVLTHILSSQAHNGI